MKKKYTLFIIILSSWFTTYSSDTIYFNIDWLITNKENAHYYRITTLTASGFYYEGKFDDYSVNMHQKISSGYYNEKQKNEEFIEYYSNGKIKSKGLYKNNNRIGLWKYFYKNGELKMVVDFNSKNFVIQEYRDTSNNQILSNGNGQCTLDVNLFGIPSKLIAVFSNGKRDGKWIYYNEKGGKLLVVEYNNGQFIDYIFKKSLSGKIIFGPYLKTTYFDDSKYLTTERLLCEIELCNYENIALKYITKILNLSNTKNLSYLNSAMPIDAITCMEKDAANNYWFGTANNGIFRLDSVFTYMPKHKKKYISAIAIDDNNGIWYAFAKEKFDYDVSSAGLAYLIDGKVKIFNTTNSELTSNNINDIHIDNSGVVWLATMNCLVSFSPREDKWVKHINELNEISIIDTIQINNREQYLNYAEAIDTFSVKVPVYQHTQSGNVYTNKTVNQQRVKYKSPKTYAEICDLPNNNLYITSTKGCSVYNNNSWKEVADTNDLECIMGKINELNLNLKTKKTAYKYLKSERDFEVMPDIFSDILVDYKHSLWIQNYNTVVKIFDEQIIEYNLHDERIKYAADGNGKNTFYTLFLDSDGGVWVGINSGIVRLE